MLTQGKKIRYPWEWTQNIALWSFPLKNNHGQIQPINIRRLPSLSSSLPPSSSPVLPSSHLRRQPCPQPGLSPPRWGRSGPEGSRMCHTAAMLCHLDAQTYRERKAAWYAGEGSAWSNNHNQLYCVHGQRIWRFHFTVRQMGTDIQLKQGPQRHVKKNIYILFILFIYTEWVIKYSISMYTCLSAMIYIWWYMYKFVCFKE